MKNRLLELLQENCKYTVQELAILLNTTPEEVKRQIAYYEETGVICGYKALINWEKVPGSDVRALIELKVMPKRD